MQLPSQWQSIMGLQFKNLVLSNQKTLHKLLDIDSCDIVNANPFFQRKTKDQSGCQIDYMIQNKFGTRYLCKIKFSNHKITMHVINEVKQKTACLNLPAHISLRPVLIHVNGVDRQVQASDFFSYIIDINDLIIIFLPFP